MYWRNQLGGRWAYGIQIDAVYTPDTAIELSVHHLANHLAQFSLVPEIIQEEAVHALLFPVV